MDRIPWGALYRARGTCTRRGCGRYTEVYIGVVEDAPYFVCHEHGYEFSHAFEGVIEVVVPKQERKAA